MNLIQRELREATELYKDAKWLLREANKFKLPKGYAMSRMNTDRTRLMNVVKAANVLLDRA